MPVTQILPDKAVAVPKPSEDDFRLLEGIASDKEKLDRSIAPIDRLEALEGMARGYLMVATSFSAKAWECLVIIKSEGLWRLIKVDGQPQWQSWEQYSVAFFEEVKKTSRRSIATKVGTAQVLMLQLGVDSSDLSALMDDKPSITANALAAAEFDQFSGQFTHIPAENKARMMAQLGIPADTVIDDRDLMKQWLGVIAEAEHGQATALVNSARNVFNIWFAYDARNDWIIVEGNGEDSNGNRIHPRRVYVPQEGQKPLFKRLKTYLLTRVRQDVFKPKSG